MNLSLPNLEIFDCRLGRKRLRPNMCFPLPRFTHVTYGLERSGNHGGQLEQVKAGWISLFCPQILFVLACFSSIEPLKILWYQNKIMEVKSNQVDFCKYNLISVRFIRCNHCKLIKLTFFVPFTKNRIFKLTKCGLSPKGFCILCSVTWVIVKTCNCSCNMNIYLW